MDKQKIGDLKKLNEVWGDSNFYIDINRSEFMEQVVDDEGNIEYGDDDLYFKDIMDTKDIEDISFSLKELIELCKKDDFFIRIYAQDKDDYETTVEIRPNKPFDMHSSIKQYLEPMITITNKEIDKLKTYFNPKEKNFILYDKKDLLIEEKILKLGKLLYESRGNSSKRIKFNSLKDEEIISLTKEIKQHIFNNKNDVYLDYFDFKNALGNINNYLYKVNVDNNVSNIKVDDTLTKYKDKYIDNYILNAIVNHADYFYKTRSRKYQCLDEDELLREIILREFKKNKNQSRYDILTNYLSNTLKVAKFKNKYQIINAIKNINSEMEDAQKEFSKLFNNYENQR